MVLQLPQLRLHHHLSGVPGGVHPADPELSASRQSFRMAMGNPCEFFVDVM